MQSRLNGTNGLYSHYENQLTAWKGSPLSEPTCDYEKSMLALMSTSDGWMLVPQASKSAFINGERRWSVYTPLSAWKNSSSDQVRTDSLPKILCGMLAEKITQCKDKSIFEIDCNHIEMGHVKLKAKEVVLAAGTLESTRLYSTLTSNASIQVYPNLNDHFVHGAVVRLPKTIEANYDVGNRAFLMRTFDNLRANLFLDIHADCHGIPTLDLWWKGEQSRNLSSRIVVREIAGKWLAVCESNLSPEDLDRIDEQRHIIREELAKFGVQPPPVRKIDFVTAMKSIAIGSQGEFYLNKLGTADHEAGTLPYGEIFSEVGRSKVFPNLFLASPAGFPWSGYANPTLTSISVAKMVAEEIAK
jgi:hypothetical protein